MDKNLSAAIVLLFLALLLALMFLGWRARKKRQAHLPLPEIAPADFGEVVGTFGGLYVATSIAGEPLNRVATNGLAFRAKTSVIVAASGIVIPIAGQHDVFIPRAHLRTASRATWTIDRVVEEEGLILIGWTLGECDVDSYFRVHEPEALLAAVTSLLSTRTGSDSK